MSNNEYQLVLLVYLDIEDWLIYKFSEDCCNFVEEIEFYMLDKMLKFFFLQVCDFIFKIIYQECICIKEEFWKVDFLKEKQFWKCIGCWYIWFLLDIDFQQVVQSNWENLQQIIYCYVEEIVGIFKISIFLFVWWFLIFFFICFFNIVVLCSIWGFWCK